MKTLQYTIALGFLTILISGCGSGDNGTLTPINKVALTSTSLERTPNRTVAVADVGGRIPVVSSQTEIRITTDVQADNLDGIEVKYTLLQANGSDTGISGTLDLFYAKTKSYQKLIKFSQGPDITKGVQIVVVSVYKNGILQSDAVAGSFYYSNA